MGQNPKQKAEAEAMLKDKSLSPLAKQIPGGLVDPYTEAAVSRANKKTGITVVSPQSTIEALAYTNGPLKDCWTVAFDRPDYNMDKLRPRYDGQAHRLPEGDGQIKRGGKKR